MPIVNRLEEDYGNEVKFVYLDANEDGKEAFSAAKFRGHPAILLMKPDGSEIWRYLGAPSPVLMEQQIQDAIN